MISEQLNLSHSCPYLPSFLDTYLETWRRQCSYLPAFENCNKIFLGMALWRAYECSLALFAI